MTTMISAEPARPGPAIRSVPGRPGALSRLLATSDDPVLTLLRVTLGVVMFPHAGQHVLGWFGGYGFAGTMGYLTDTVGVPSLLAGLGIAAELLGSLGLIAGLATRAAALGILGVMAVAALAVHLPNGFFMNWLGNQGGEGFEYHILAGVIAVTLMVRGGGALSLDRRLTRGR